MSNASHTCGFALNLNDEPCLACIDEAEERASVREERDAREEEMIKRSDWERDP